MDDDYPDEMEERLINDEYKIWKKNTPFLYGVCLSASKLLPRPTSTCTEQGQLCSICMGLDLYLMHHCF